MATYQYSATKEGEDRSGEIEAPDLEAARNLLEAEGLAILTLSLKPPAEASGDLVEQLTIAEAQELAEHLAQLGLSAVPLAAGFRAAAAEASSTRVANALNRIATEVERGATFDEILSESKNWLPRHVAGLIVAALRTGRLGDALSDVAEHQRLMQTLRRTIVDAFAYPLLVGVISLALIILLLFTLGGAFAQIFKEFEMQLPLLTLLLFWWRDVGIWILAAIIGVTCLAAFLYRLEKGEAAWLRLKATIPLIGPLGHWLGLAQWAQLMSVLIKYEIPTPQALRLSADGVNQSHIREMSLDLAEGCERGLQLSQLLDTKAEFPRSILPIVDWGERNRALSEAFELGTDLLVKRVQLRSALLRGILPPLLFIAIGCGVLLLVGGLMFPLFKLLNDFS